jgi:hypothetical protein
MVYVLLILDQWFMLLQILGSNGLCFFHFLDQMVYASSTSWIKWLMFLLILDKKMVYASSNSG